MVEGAKGSPEAGYFLSSGCAPLRQGLGVGGLLLPQVLPAHLAANDGGAIDLGARRGALRALVGALPLPLAAAPVGPPPPAQRRSKG